MWSLFLDDERNPKDVFWIRYKNPDIDWVICRNMKQVKTEIAKRGLPSVFSLDHDLGLLETGYDILQEMCIAHLDGASGWEEGIDAYFHSKNNIGVKNMQGYLQSYAKNADLVINMTR